MSLSRCETCARHLRSSDSVCPFCRARRNVVAAAVSAIVGTSMGACFGAVYGGPPANVYGGPPPGDSRERIDAAYQRCADMEAQGDADAVRCYRWFLERYGDDAPRAEWMHAKDVVSGSDAGTPGATEGGLPPLPADDGGPRGDT
jgi:hypothetical protein